MAHRKQSNTKSRGPQPRKAQGDTCLMPFHHVIAAGGSAGAFALGANPTNLSTRALSEADNWAHFRLKSLKFRVLPAIAPVVAASTGVSTLALCYIGGIEDTPPAQIADVMEVLPSTLYTGACTIPTKWVVVPKSDLAGPLPWYKTIPGTADSTEEAPGQLCYVVAIVAATTIYIELSGVFEFKTSVSATNTPLAIKLRTIVRDERKKIADEVERKALQKVLCPPPSMTASTILLP